MLLIRRINYYVIILLFFISGCNSHPNDTYQDYHDSLIYDEDFGFCGYISCVDNHNVVKYKLPRHKDFPNQNKYDSILIEIMGYADKFIEQGTVDELLDYLDMSVDSIVRKINKM